MASRETSASDFCNSGFLFRQLPHVQDDGDNPLKMSLISKLSQALLRCILNSSPNCQGTDVSTFSQSHDRRFVQCEVFFPCWPSLFWAISLHLSLHQLTRTERSGYATSADVSGDKSRVVGYAGMLLG